VSPCAFDIFVDRVEKCGTTNRCPSRERVLESKSQAQFHLTLYSAPVQSFTNNLNKDEGDISYLLMTQIWEAQ
jgi:hypothetical protein